MSTNNTLEFILNLNNKLRGAMTPSCKQAKAERRQARLLRKAEQARARALARQGQTPLSVITTAIIEAAAKILPGQ